MSDTIPVAQLRAFVERIERIEADIKDLNGDKSEVYKELRGCGFDVKAVRAVVAKRKLDTADREERDAMFDLYWSALNGPSRVHVHEARSYAEEKGRDIGNTDPLSHDAETGEITDDQLQPVPADQHVAATAAQDDVGATASSTDSEHTISPAPERKAAGSAPREMGGEGANTGGEDVDRSASARPSGQVVGAQPAGVDAGIEPGFVERNTSGPDAKRATNPHSPDDLLPVVASTLSNPSLPTPVPLGSATSERGADVAAASPSYSDDDVPAFIKQDKPDCLKLKDGHCRLSFATSALCAECNQRRAMARALV